MIVIRAVRLLPINQKDPEPCPGSRRTKGACCQCTAGQSITGECCLACRAHPLPRPVQRAANHATSSE